MALRAPLLTTTAVTHDGLTTIPGRLRSLLTIRGRGSHHAVQTWAAPRWGAIWRTGSRPHRCRRPHHRRGTDALNIRAIPEAREGR